jgi:hypothetical protein
MRHEWLGDFTQLVRRHNHDIQSNLAERSSDNPQEGNDFCHNIPTNVPGDGRILETQFLCEILADQQAFIICSEGSQSTRSTTKLDQEASFFDLVKAFEVPLESREIHSCFVTEGHWQGMLEMSSASHGS